MKKYYALISLWISVALFSNAAFAVDIVNLLSDDITSQSHRIINQRFERISEKLSGKLESRFRISYREMIPSEYRISNLKILLGMDTRAQKEPDIKNYYAVASHAKVYDDNGKPITEEEIRAYMISDYRIGCFMLGGVVGPLASIIPALYMIAVHDYDPEANPAVFVTVMTTCTVASWLVGYKYGKEIDRRKAIELIKEERRTNRKQPQPRPKFLPKVRGCFGIGAASCIILMVISSGID